MSEGPLALGALAIDAGGCPGCGQQFGAADKFCEACGTRLKTEEPPPSLQRVELEEPGVGAVSDRGLRRARNEDAIDIAGSSARSIAVVCDGVASTVSADQASAAAALAVRRELEVLLDLAQLPDADELEHRFAAALDEARRAVAAVPFDPAERGGLSPSTTLVACVVDGSQVGLVHVGDSRAYWLPAEGEEGRLLTVDDSLAQELIASGLEPVDAFADPQAHTITRWIGGDVVVESTLQLLELASPGWLLLCTDGLWGYFDAPSKLARLAQQSPDWTAIGIARHLVEAAVAAGGQDNISAAVLPTGPQVTTAGSSSEER